MVRTEREKNPLEDVVSALPGVLQPLEECCSPVAHHADGFSSRRGLQPVQGCCSPCRGVLAHPGAFPACAWVFRSVQGCWNSLRGVTGPVQVVLQSALLVLQPLQRCQSPWQGCCILLWGVSTYPGVF